MTVKNETITCLFCGSPKSQKFRNRADIVRCSNCEVVYLRTRPTAETMYDIYQKYAQAGSHMQPPASVGEAKRSGLRREYFVRETLEFVDAGNSWLDVGCGWGALLDFSRELGFTAKGIELTRNCLDFATMQLGIPVSNSQLVDSSLPSSSCRVVSMVHVFEHLPFPKAALNKVYEVLEPGGIFCGIVPNIDSYCSSVKKENWVWLDETHHYVHYSPNVLQKKLEEAGFITERIYTAVGDYDYEEVKDTVAKSLGYPTSENAVLEKIKQLEQQGAGEEIRFFVRKPLSRS